MRTTTLMTALTLVLLLTAGAALGAGMGESAGHDLDDLWQQAQKTYDLEQEDAVLLLESRHVTVSDDGALATRVHRVVWIGTSRGIREYADLRVPWNSATSTLDVEILRTWMDGRWWPDAQRISDTAVVHTLPYAANRADDYTSMRETMLLHDGVELPCIMETAYTIAEQGSPAAGADGVFVIPQRDPAVLTEYVVRVPTATDIKTEALNGAPAAGTVTGSGVRTLTWRVENSPALGLPRTDRPARYEPSVAWSTWDTWVELSQVWWQSFLAAATVSDELAEKARERCLSTFAPRAEVAAIMDFIEEQVRTIRYDPGFWRMAPRNADRVWETGYGHVLDKAVLGAALLEAAGYTVTPVFVDEPGGTMFLSVPCFDALGDLMLQARYDEIETWNNRPVLCDPAGGTVHGETFLAGRSRFQFGDRTQQYFGPTEPSMHVVMAILEPADDGDWQGNVTHDADQFFHYLDAAGGEGLDAHLDAVAGSVLAGTEAANARPLTVGTAGISATADLTLAASEEDETRFVVGAPAGGVLDRLPGDLHLHDAERGSPVLLGTALQQMVSLRVKIEGREVAHRPASRQVSNAAGRWEIVCEVVDGWLQYARTLELNGRIEATDWPALRILLLEEADAANATIVLE